MPSAGPASRGGSRSFGSSAAKPEKRVFINCPFDPDYEPIQDAILFTTVCCGFTPSSALESGTIAELRIDRILRGLAGAKYSIHDLSRCRGEGDEQLARFNMPLELGAAMALRHQAPLSYDWAVLVPEGHVYARFVSDLAGYDPLRYDESPESVVPRLMGWLTTRPDAIESTVTPRDVLEALPSYRRKKRELMDAWVGEVPWEKLLKGASAVVRASPVLSSHGIGSADR